MSLSSLPFISILSNPNVNTQHSKTTTSLQHDTAKSTKKSKRETARRHERCAHEEKPTDRGPLPTSSSYAVKFGSVSIVTGALFSALQSSLKTSNKATLKTISPPSSPSSSSSSSISSSFRFHFPNVVIEDDTEILCDSLPIDSATPSETSSLSDSESETELDRKPSRQPLPRLVLASDMSVCQTNNATTERSAWSNTPSNILMPSYIPEPENSSVSECSFVSKLGAASSGQQMAVASGESKPRRKRGDLTIQQKREVERAELQKQLRYEEAYRAKKAARQLRKLHKTMRKAEDRAFANKYEVWPEDKPAATIEGDDVLEQLPSSISKQARAQLRAEERSRGQEKRDRTQNFHD